MADIFDMVDTWNNGATTFTAIKMDVTDTASAAASKLLDLLVGGVSRFSVSKAGDLGLTTNTKLYLGAAVSPFMQFASTLIKVNSARGLAWTSSADASGVEDLVLLRDAADTLAQRRGTNPQAFRLYNTYTDASNYERGKFAWASNVLQIGTEKAGTGSARQLDFQTGGTTRLSILPTGSVVLSPDISLMWNSRTRVTAPADGILRITNNATTAGATLEMLEQTAPSAPATNAVRIYAEDNGAGKTRLMALFATGAAQQIAIEP